MNKAVEGGKNCLAHGGNRQLDAQEAGSLRNYRLTKFRSKVARMGDSPEIKSLRDEIGILRVIMEETINKCEDETDLLLESARITDLVFKIDKVVTSCHKLEGSMGQLLDKQAILQFASEVIDVIGDVLEGQDENMEEISSRILEIVGRQGESK
jgi:hypothetical protein